MADVVVVGAGLAGTECAWQLAERGVSVRLIEQKPSARTPAQHSDQMAELVCSNSFRGAAIHNAVGLLKEEIRRAGSLVMEVGEIHRVPAGGAFAVDREIGLARSAAGAVDDGATSDDEIMHGGLLIGMGSQEDSRDA